ncbi:MAG TPA: alpha/beta fold hydrolase, partial [Candidatus Binataceae bacterium]
MAETFVLVHGGSLGGWSWAAVIAQLQKLGHRAMAVDLPGRGENPYDLAKITLAVHIDAVTRYIEERGLRDVVLLGHSMAGIIIPGVTVRMPDRIKRLIFMSAMVMLDGESPM